ncbi:acetyl-CoA synthetase-like protein, partial [Aureobasidium melanogenum]
MDNPTIPMLSPQASSMLQRAPLLAFGTLDSEGRPWTTAWGGRKGFSQPLGNSMIAIRTSVAARLDPVVEALVGRNAKGEIVKEEGEGRLLSGLAIDLDTRKRVKLAGRMVAGTLGIADGENDTDDYGKQGILQLVARIDESLGNCPKYLNRREISPATPDPQLISDTAHLDERAVELLHKADLMFLSTSSGSSMDTNHRGGPPGFVRCLKQEGGCTQFIYPEYSGNRLYQSLGNMMLEPRAGFCFPDFDTGNCLFVTGRSEILFGKEAAEVMPRSNLAVRVTVTAARLVASVLPFRGNTGEFSPYNPVVRYLISEQAINRTEVQNASHNAAKLLAQIPLTPTISRFKFSLSNAATYTAGQYVTIDVSDHLDVGYSHMRDDDPRSLNDDFVRTFTVSSPPGVPPHPSKRLADDEFEITIRKVGVVTDFLFKHGLNPEAHGSELEIGIKGFGGSFVVEQTEEKSSIAFVAAGVGITPLMPCLHSLRLEHLQLFWTLRAVDLGLAVDLLDGFQDLAANLTLFVTGIFPENEEQKAGIGKLNDCGVHIVYRRMERSDLELLIPKIERWYICTEAIPVPRAPPSASTGANTAADMTRETPEYGTKLLPTLVDEIATTTPNRVYASVPKDDADMSKGFKDVTYADFARAIDALSWWLEETLGKADGTFPTFAYFGPRDLGYAIVVVAAAKVGRKVLLASHLASPDAHLLLLGSLSCTAVIYASKMTALAEALRERFPSAKYISTTSFGAFLTQSHTSANFEHYVYSKPYSKAHSDPVMVVHTSGTTGLPKPVIWTNDMLCSVDRLHTLPGSAATQMAGQRIYCALPTFHTSGITASLLTPVYLSTIIILGPAGVRPDKQTVLDVLRNAPVSAASFPPSLLEELIADPVCRKALKQLKKIVYGGAPLAAWAIRIIGSEFSGTVSSALGSTEGGLWLTGSSPDPADQGYFLIHPFMAPDFQHTDADLYELVIKRTPKSEAYTNFFRCIDSTPSHLAAHFDFDTKESINEFRTKDLFSPHPTKPGLWKYRCRKDDLVLLSGEVKMYAGAIEEAISAHPAIGAVVVGGQYRSRPFLMVEPATSITTNDQKAEFVNEIWPAVEAENEKHHDSARLQKELVVIVEPEKKMMRTPKGTVDRKATLSAFEGEIDQVYKAWSKM